MQAWLSGDGPTGLYVVLGQVAHTLLIGYCGLVLAADAIRRLTPRTYAYGLLRLCAAKGRRT